MQLKALRAIAREEAKDDHTSSLLTAWKFVMCQPEPFCLPMFLRMPSTNDTEKHAQSRSCSPVAAQRAKVSVIHGRSGGEWDNAGEEESSPTVIYGLDILYQMSLTSLNLNCSLKMEADIIGTSQGYCKDWMTVHLNTDAVSYTHLTLPTSLRV